MVTFLLPINISVPRAAHFAPVPTPLPPFLNAKLCPDGSYVMPFHPCRWADLDNSDDGGEGGSSSLSVLGLPLFQCRLGQPVHYSLVCDGRDDCADGSDEMGCPSLRFEPLQGSTWQCR